MHRSILATLMAALAATSVGHAMAAKAAKTTTHKYKGPSVDMRWGPVQATITVKGKKITKVSIATSPENRRSQMLDDMSVPVLKQETLQTQNASIDEVSGATMTSDAYIQSLAGALKKAHLPTGL